jgi:Mlc titration factor MtfA (ptsG expression regulator)
VMTDLLRGPRWEAARGFELTDEVRVLIAAQAAIPVLALGAGCYDDVETIIVHPTTVRFDAPRPGPVPGTVTSGPNPLAGRATHRGPIVIAWDSAKRDARHPERGRDVVIHEFAHALDMIDGVLDGTPPLPEGDIPSRWARTFGAELRALRRGGTGGVFRTYASTSAAELFAVASEAFFCRPVRLEEERPAVYDLLRTFYRQDPAERFRRAGRGTSTGISGVHSVTPGADKSG